MNATQITRWQTGNDRFLSAGVAWIRQRLANTRQEVERHLGDRGQPTAGEFVKQRGNETMTGADRSFSGNGWHPGLDLANPTGMDPPPALHILAQRLGLSAFEQEILLLCAAMDLDTRTARLCAAAQDDPQRPFPTFALALALFDDPAWDALSPERPLRYWQLIEIDQPAGRPLTACSLRIDERILNFLKGLNYLDDRLATFLFPFDAQAGVDPLPPTHQACADRLASELEPSAAGDSPATVQLVGNDPLGQQLVAAQVAGQFRLQLYRLPVDLLPGQSGDLERLVRLWQRESRLLPLALYLDTQEWGSSSGGQEEAQANIALRRFLARRPGLVFLAGREAQPGLDPAGLTADVNKPATSEQRQVWLDSLRIEGQAIERQVGRLAEQFNLNTTIIRHVARQGQVLIEAEPEQLYRRLWKACLAQTRPRLGQLAQRLELKSTWEDLVLPQEEMALLQQIADQAGQRSQVYDAWGFRNKLNRGLGISALFAGESGTGKTMAAEVLAHDLDLDLYRIDLSAVVSKYIGETEKNLRRLFDSAEDGGVVLFFDEADALFGKRSEVKDSHDRYANIEINYLLQRIEAYRGLAILATNMKSALDQAFLRRLRFVVNFPYPGLAERKAIWQKVFPVQLPVRGLDYDRLARLNLTGGSIHNIALNAAFLAAQAGTAVTMGQVLEAARAELRKMERPINEAELRWPS